jgi:two-component sensor histidine kinase
LQEISLQSEALVLHQKREVEQARTQAVGELAAKIAHDIRSPLSALNMILGQLAQLPEAQRLIIRNSVNRINDIANELLTKGKQQQEQISSTSKATNHVTPLKLSVQLLSPLIDSLVSEKRVQFREKQGVEIEADISLGYGLFANVNDTELKRVLSNLLNNAIEAFPEDKGRVIVSICGDGAVVSLTVKDNGNGIPKQILEKLGEMGVTHGKAGSQSGSGLGVYHAKKTVESFGGTFQVSSEEGLGTTITMSFPRTQAPNWFVEKLSFTPGMQIISVDDDLSVHNIWKGRFVSTRLLGQIEHLTFTSAIEFKNWFHENKSDDAIKPVRVYLMDFELLNQNTTGLDIIAELGIGAQSILVTSRYEELHIRERCEKLGVRLIPKNMAGFVPMEIEKPREYFDAILIDDDTLVELSWQMMAKEKNKKFLYFNNPDDFYQQLQSFDLDCPIYVDSNLGNGIKGEEVSKKISELGFRNINICTGYQVSEFPAMPWVKSIIGKDPIF